MGRFYWLSLLMLALALPGMTQAARSLVHDGDVWVCLGDSITAQDTYRRQLARAFQHYHPEAKLTVINSGMAGDTASEDPQKLTDRVLKYHPTIVSVMYGMNECINSWHRGTPTEPVLTRYRRSLTYIAQTLKQQGVTVLLMSPTLTDPTCRWSFFTIDDTVPVLQQCAAIMRDVATQEGVNYIPLQETLAAFQQALPPDTGLQSDGVHVSALGQNMMAKTIYDRCRFAESLGGPRTVSEPAPAAPVAVALAARFVDPAAPELRATFTSAQACTAILTWSIGDQRKQETLPLAQGETTWTLPLPAAVLPTRDGQNTDLLFDLRVGDARSSLYVVDLCRTRVLHFVNGVVSGTVDSEKARPEGKNIATWQLTRSGTGLLFTGEVFDSEINCNSDWPFARDGFNFMFDFRPTNRFAGISVDHDVHQTMINVREQPFFAASLRPWTGEGMGSAATAMAEKTPTGYRCKLYIGDNFNLHKPADIANRDYIGILVSVNDLDTDPANPKNTTLTITAGQKNDYAVDQYANNLMIIDMKGKLPGDETINAHLFPPAK